MNWNDIDFSAIQNMVNSFSDEEKQNIQQMAKNMMKEAPIQEEEEELTTSQRLGWDEGMFIQLPGKMQDDLESALDLEDYYEEDQEDDLSAPVLFYAKALLDACRGQLAPIFRNVLNLTVFETVNYTTLGQYLDVLSDENIRILADEQFGETSLWITVREILSFTNLLLQRAQYDRISYSDLLILKERLIDKKEILLPFSL